MKTYKEKLLDPRWQKKRLEILQRDGFYCRICGDNKSTLHVHHKRYTKGEPWESDEADLVTLCADCHETEPENKKRAIEEVLGQLKELTSDEIDGLSYLLNIKPALTLTRTWDVFCFIVHSKELMLGLEKHEYACEDARRYLPLKIDIENFENGRKTRVESEG